MDYSVYRFNDIIVPSDTHLIVNMFERDAHEINSLLKTDRKTGCQIWQGLFNGDGVGLIRIKGKYYAIHRIVYAWKVGPVPHGKDKGRPILQSVCGNRRCCNVDHMRLVFTARGKFPILSKFINRLKAESVRG